MLGSGALFCHAFSLCMLLFLPATINSYSLAFKSPPPGGGHKTDLDSSGQQRNTREHGLRLTRGILRGRRHAVVPPAPPKNSGEYGSPVIVIRQRLTNGSRAESINTNVESGSSSSEDGRGPDPVTEEEHLLKGYETVHPIPIPQTNTAYVRNKTEHDEQDSVGSDFPKLNRTDRDRQSMITLKLTSLISSSGQPTTPPLITRALPNTRAKETTTDWPTVRGNQTTQRTIHLRHSSRPHASNQDTQLQSSTVSIRGRQTNTDRQVTPPFSFLKVTTTAFITSKTPPISQSTQYIPTTQPSPTLSGPVRAFTRLPRPHLSTESNNETATIVEESSIMPSVLKTATSENSSDVITTITTGNREHNISSKAHNTSGDLLNRKPTQPSNGTVSLTSSKVIAMLSIRTTHIPTTETGRGPIASRESTSTAPSSDVPVQAVDLITTLSSQLFPRLKTPHPSSTSEDTPVSPSSSSVNNAQRKTTVSHAGADSPLISTERKPSLHTTLPPTTSESTERITNILSNTFEIAQTTEANRLPPTQEPTTPSPSKTVSYVSDSAQVPTQPSTPEEIPISPTPPSQIIQSVPPSLLTSQTAILQTTITLTSATPPPLDPSSVTGLPKAGTDNPQEDAIVLVPSTPAVTQITTVNRTFTGKVPGHRASSDGPEPSAADETPQNQKVTVHHVGILAAEGEKENPTEATTTTHTTKHNLEWVTDELELDLPQRSRPSDADADTLNRQETADTLNRQETITDHVSIKSSNDRTPNVTFTQTAGPQGNPHPTGGSSRKGISQLAIIGITLACAGLFAIVILVIVIIGWKIGIGRNLRRRQEQLDCCFFDSYDDASSGKCRLFGLCCPTDNGPNYGDDDDSDMEKGRRLNKPASSHMGPCYQDTNGGDRNANSRYNHRHVLLTDERVELRQSNRERHDLLDDSNTIKGKEVAAGDTLTGVKNGGALLVGGLMGATVAGAVGGGGDLGQTDAQKRYQIHQSEQECLEATLLLELAKATSRGYVMKGDCVDFTEILRLNESGVNGPTTEL